MGDPLAEASGQSEIMETFNEFLAWERASRDSIDFKTAYVDMTGDLRAGLLLSQILYWHLPDRKGRTKLRVQTSDGRLWLVKAASEWWSEIRLTAKQSRDALKILRKKGLVETEIHRFDGTPKTHIHLRQDAFLISWHLVIKVGDEIQEARLALEGKSEMPQGADLNRPVGQIHNIDYPENTETETTTSCHDAAASLFDQNLQSLSDLGITEPKRSRLAALPHVSPQYLREWEQWLERRRSEGRELGPGFLVRQIEGAAPVPNGHERQVMRGKGAGLPLSQEERWAKYLPWAQGTAALGQATEGFTERAVMANPMEAGSGS